MISTFDTTIATPTTRATPIILAIASGKGGVGKTSLTLNLATLLSKQKQHVVVLDGDTGLANADVQLNLTPTFDLAHVLAGNCTLAQAVTPTPHGFGLIAGRSGHSPLVGMPLPVMHQWLQQLSTISATHILLDLPAGVSPTTLAMAAAAHTTIMVTTPDPSSLTDSYAFIKLLWQQHHVTNAKLLVNQASRPEGQLVHQRLSAAATNFLQLPPLPLLGIIPLDRAYTQAIRHHHLAAISAPHSPAIMALATILAKLP